MPSPLRHVAIVGAGFAGLACAAALGAAGLRVSVFDKGSRPGGRCATRRDPAGVLFDHGAQYVTARDPGFAGAIADVTTPWPTGGDGALIGEPGMAALPAHLAAALPPGAVVAQRRQVGALHAGDWRLRLFGTGEIGPSALSPEGGTLAGPFDAVVLAIPAAQAALHLAALGHPFAAPVAAIRHAPCLALMLTFDAPLAAPDVIRPQDSPFAWLACQSARPGASRMPEAWVAHATPDASAALLDAPDAQLALVAAFRDATGAPGPATAAVHRWRYARVMHAHGQPCLYDPAARLGVCGDGMLAPRAEAAFVSGAALAAAMLAA